ncbi:hypothetical protein Tco_0735630, partial [Tanacetum coccineum]
MDLKQTKLTMGNAIVKLVKKVKKLEGFMKRRNLVLTDSEEEEPEVQGRKSQDDPLDSSVQGLVTPPTTKVNTSGEEQVEEISPNTLEAAKTLSKVASLKSRSIDKGRRYKRRKETKGKKVVSSLDFQEEVDAGAEQVNTASNEQVSTVGTKESTSSQDKGQREGKAPMISEETPKKSKEQILQEEASLAEAIRLDTLQKEEVAKQVHLDSLLAQRIAEEEELNEQQKKRKAQVQFEAQHYTNEDWDLIRAKIEANAELSKSMLGSELQGEDFAKKMVDLVNQRKKYFAEERARAKRNKPMTQSQLKTYMMNYLKNQGTWKLSQLKNLSFEEVKEEFDKLVKQVESFAPINFEATKASLKRFGEELQTKTPKRLKDDEAKDDESTKKSGKRRKQMARRGLHTNVDKDDSEDSDEVGEQEESVTGTKTPINHVPVAMKTPSIATYKIFKQGEKGAYQIVREDGTDVVYINFGAMLKVISRDDLTELYRIVMNRYGMDGPEDELEKVFWKYLKNMFEEPLSTDPIWSELGQQRIIKTSRTLEESNSIRDSCLVALQNKQTELEKYKTFNDRTVDYEKLEHKLNETLGLLAQKDIDIKEGLKLKAYEILVVKEKHDELVKQSLLTKSHYEGLVKDKTKVITDLKLKEEKDIDKMISMEKQLKFLNEIVYKRSQSIQTIHKLAPKCPTFNGRPTFANLMCLKKAQSKIPCLYEIPRDQSNPANSLIPNREETLTLKRESRSKLNKDLTCLMPLALKTQNDSFAFVHELKQEMHADLKYVESLEKE